MRLYVRALAFRGRGFSGCERFRGFKGLEGVSWVLRVLRLFEQTRFGVC